MTGQALLVRGDALRLPIADESVDLICTSPPFFALRSYTDQGEAYTGQVGAEPTPVEYLEALWAATHEMVRVLKPSGSIWINLGDKYTGGGGQWEHDERPDPQRRRIGKTNTRGATYGIRQKSLLGLPWLYALGCTGALRMLGGPDPGLNLILRAEVIWHKANGLPESVTDRVRRSHEQWFHLVKQPRYYRAVDEIREATTRGGMTWQQRLARGDATRQGEQRGTFGDGMAPNPLGKLPGSVWTIPSEPLIVPEHLGVDHYAAMPSEWPRRLILGWSPPGICVACGEGQRPVVESARTPRRPSQHKPTHAPPGQTEHGASGRLDFQSEHQIRGYACACTPYTDHPGTGGSSGERYGDQIMDGRRPANFDSSYGPTETRGLSNRPKVGPWRDYHLDGWKPPPTRPAVVLDPFCGTGTTPMVARALGRIGIGIDLSGDYLRLANWRIWDSGHASKALARTNAERQTALDLGDFGGLVDALQDKTHLVHDIERGHIPEGA